LHQRHEEQLREKDFGMFGQPQHVSEGGEEMGNDTGTEDAAYLGWKRKVWHDRSSWWRHKHFHEKSVNSEQQVDGDWNRIAYKAACSVHVLGVGNAYETSVTQALTTSRAESLLSMVNAHRPISHVRLADNHRSMDSDSSHM